MYFFFQLHTPNTIEIKRVLLAVAQHRRQHSAFGWVYSQFAPKCSALKGLTQGIN